VAIKVFEGNTSDSQTLVERVEHVRETFGLSRIVIVGDRGMITSKHIEGPLGEMAGVGWITALKSSSIRGLIAHAVERAKNPLRGAEAIGLRVGKVVGRHKMAKHFILDITEDSFAYRRNEESIREEEKLDGIYVVRSNVAKEEMSAGELVKSYKSLSQVERAFRSMKTVDLKVRPIYHYKEERVRAHVFLCMLAFHVEWHLRQDLAPLLYQDEDKDLSESERTSPVAKAIRSKSAKTKDASNQNSEGFAVQSFGALLDTLGILCKNEVVFKSNPNHVVIMLTRPNALQNEAFRLVGSHP
jgi:transposase